MKRWWVVILLLLSVGLNIGLLVQRGRERNERAARREARQAEERKDPGGAESREARNRQRMERLVARMVEEVGVAGQQRDQFVAIQESFFDRTLATRQRLRQSQRALRDNLSSPQPDRALAEKQAAEIAEAQKEIEAAFIDNFFATSAILDQNQQQRYRSLVAELRRLRWDRGRRHESSDDQERRRSRREQPKDHDSAADQDPPRN